MKYLAMNLSRELYISSNASKEHKRNQFLIRKPMDSQILCICGGEAVYLKYSVDIQKSIIF